ncbi:SOS response-associated peptidase [Portibacter lacus]|uniref:Abasic site processing protein n=1 Tax=Portibacter lacus TaxID=1099794 RepID=A0AA37SVZ4_9BACT|nr:SOS response-associated peptidase [Portibacter lacus]GLR19008.1 putative SOS response-associated peptidase YoqW [Portibacter lacus]
MCGRSSLTKNEKELEERFNATFYSDELESYNPIPNFNVAPTHYMPVITSSDPEHIHIFRWGLLPFWSKDEKIAYKMINARVETILEKNSFKKAVQSRRCLVPMDGFYEWKRSGKEKLPYRIVTTDQEIFSVAGIWERWKSPEGKEIYTFSVITKPPNEIMEGIHDRMPAILLPEQEKLWLDEELPAQEAIQLITDYPANNMKAYRVSKRVNSVKENDKTLIEAIPENNNTLF